jgi:hypothetical protein
LTLLRRPVESDAEASCVSEPFDVLEWFEPRDSSDDSRFVRFFSTFSMVNQGCVAAGRLGAREVGGFYTKWALKNNGRAIQSGHWGDVGGRKSIEAGPRQRALRCYVSRQSSAVETPARKLRRRHERRGAPSLDPRRLARASLRSTSSACHTL